MGATYLNKTSFWFASSYIGYNVILGLEYMAVNFSLQYKLGYTDQLRDYHLHNKNSATWNWLSVLYLIFIFQNTSHTNEHVAVLMCKDIGSQQKPVGASKSRSSVVIPYVCEQGIDILLTASELQICCLLKAAEFLDVLLCDLIDSVCNYQIHAITSYKMVNVRHC
jgi:hypothetical protein